MKPFFVHYKNKYPGSRVECSDSSVSVTSSDGELLVMVQKNGAGQWVDVGEEYGAKEKHDLSPIPRDARVHKLCGKSHCVKLDEESKKRTENRKKFGEDSHGYFKVHSMEELEARGYKFDEKGNCTKFPAA